MSFEIALTVIGAVVLLIGLFSGLLRRSPISENMLALGAGVALGPAALGWLAPHQWGDERQMMERVAQLTIAIGLMGTALRLPPHFFRRHWRSMLVMLGPVMIGTWLVGGAAAWLALGVGWLTALVIGAVLAPTDPVLASSIITGRFAERHLPVRLRETIAAESGANDGLAIALVMLPVLLLGHAPSAALADWVTQVVLWQVIGAVVIGATLGRAAGQLLEWAERHHTIERTSLLAYSLALSLVVLGLSELVGSNGLLAVFAAGRAFISVVTVRERHAEERMQEAVNRFFLLPIFVFLGLVLPWDAWRELGASALVFALLVLLLRRLPVMWLMRRRVRLLTSDAELAFAGWFGPMGVAALLYALHAERMTGLETLWPVASLVVVGSIVVHGVTAPLLTRRMGSDEAGDRPKEAR